MTIDPANFEPQGKPTKEQVRAIWDAHPEPSVRVIADKLVGMGYSIGFSTVGRWKREGWTDKPRPQPALEDIGKPNVRAVNKALKAELEKQNPPAPAKAEGIDPAVVGGEMTDKDVARIEAMRAELKLKDVTDLRAELEKDRLIYNIILLREATRKANIQVLIPKETSEFVGKFTEDAKAAAGPAPILPPAASPALNGNGHMQALEGEFKVVSPARAAIQKFLAKENA